MAQPRVHCLVLDAGPLLSLTPLRGLAHTYFTVPHVLSELKDKNARQHFDRLGLLAGAEIQVRNPDASSVAKVVMCAKKTGDIAVLSPADLAVIALTLQLHEERASQQCQLSAANCSPSSPSILADTALVDTPTTSDSPAQPPQAASSFLESLDDLAHALPHTSDPSVDVNCGLDQSVAADSLDESSSSEDDGEGEWITPDNVALHKSRALDLIPDAEPSTSRAAVTDVALQAGCMTADYAVQNVLMHLDLNLVGLEGTRITAVKTWVLRCHACFKICKDSSKKFCPSCGNATLLRTSISTKAAETPGGEPSVQLHLKKNFQYRTRGTIYSIPAPRPGSSKKGTGEGLILREDQLEWVRAVNREKGRQAKDEKRMMTALAESSATGVKVGNWNDADWVPEMLLVGSGGKGRSMREAMPKVGHGRRNPNERRKK